MLITCPRCKEVVEPQGSLCSKCGASLKDAIEQVKEAERALEEEKQKKEEQRRKEQKAAERKAQEQQEAAERKLQEQQKAAERAEQTRIWKRQVKARRIKTTVCMFVSLILIAALINYIRTRPPVPEVWTPVVSGGEITGLWQGSAELPLLLNQIVEMDVSKLRIVFTIAIDNRRDPDNMSLSLAFDFNKMLNERSLPATIREEFRALLRQELPVNDSYVLAETMNGSVADINQIAAIAINQKKNKIRWQMPLGSFEWLDIDTVECILKKTADLKEYGIGEYGEAGVVFYDKGFYSDGWRYLEIALSAIQKTQWSNGSSFITGLSTEIGEGDFNTANIINLLGHDTAAYAASIYRGGNKDNWYLGNGKEMQMAYKSLCAKGQNRRRAKKVNGYEKYGSFFPYWTSTQSSRNKASLIYTWVIFCRGSLLDGGISTTYNVRPIRKF